VAFLPSTPLDALPLWGVFVFSLLLVLASVEGGYRLGRRRHVRAHGEKEGPVGAIVGSALGLLAFLLGFTYSFAGGRMDARRVALLEEANAIGTTYLRADMLPEPHRTEVRSLLREYVDVRLALVTAKDLAPGVARTDEIQHALWSHAVEVGRANPEAEVFALFIDSLNETIDAHAKRAQAVRTRVSVAVWGVLFGLALLGFSAQGYHNGLAETQRSPAVVTLAMAFSMVIWLVANLDRPQEGVVQLSQQPMLDVQAMMHEDTN
jgi:hypothetical protein